MSDTTAKSVVAEFAAKHVPATENYKVVANLAEAKTAAASDNSLQNIIISDGSYHALVKKGGNGSDIGLAGWKADFSKAGYVPMVAFLEPAAKGVSDVSKPLTRAIDEAKKLSLGVEMPDNGNYSISQQIKVLDGTKYLHGNGSTLKPTDVITESAIKIETGSKNVVVDGLVLDMNGAYAEIKDGVKSGGLTGILAQGTHDTAITNNTIFGGGGNGIDVGAVLQDLKVKKIPLSTSNVLIEGNHIQLPEVSSERGSGKYAIKVGGVGKKPEEFDAPSKEVGELWQAAFKDTRPPKEGEEPKDFTRWSLYAKGEGKEQETDPAMTATGIKVTNNMIHGGRYGIGFDFVGKADGSSDADSQNHIAGNYISSNSRNISMQNSSHHTLIENNLLVDAKSTSVLLGYNSDNNTVINNKMSTSFFDQQSPVHINTGSENNLVQNNVIEAEAPSPSSTKTPGQWLMYAGADVSGTKFVGNIVSGESHRSGIGVEAIWDSTSANSNGKVEGASSYAASVQTDEPNEGNPYSGGNGAVNNVEIKDNILAPSMVSRGNDTDMPAVYLGADTSNGWNAEGKYAKYVFPSRDIVGDLDLSAVNNTMLGTEGTAYTKLLTEHEGYSARVNGDDRAGGFAAQAGHTVKGDTVYSITDYSLAPNGKETNLTLLGNTAKTKAVGNDADNAITGSIVENVLEGGAGKDTLNGGAGNDILTGGTGADTFVFASQVDENNWDDVKDFDGANGDKISLSEVVFGTLPKDANWFAEQGEQATADTRIIQRGQDLYFDADGTGAAYSEVKFAKVGTAVLKDEDFMISSTVL